MSTYRIADHAGTSGTIYAADHEDIGDLIRDWYPDAPAEITDALDRLDDAVRSGSPDEGALTTFLDISVERLTTTGLCADYVAEYFPENAADRLIAFREALAATDSPQSYADGVARFAVKTDQAKRTKLIPVDAGALLAYLDVELADDSAPDPDVEPELAAVAAAASSVLKARVLDAVAVGVPISRVAEVAEISRPTIYRWVQDSKS